MITALSVDTVILFDHGAWTTLATCSDEQWLFALTPQSHRACESTGNTDTTSALSFNTTTGLFSLSNTEFLTKAEASLINCFFLTSVQW